MNMFDIIINDLQYNAIKYIVCAAGAFMVMKYLADHPKRKMFILGGIGLLVGTSLLSTLVHAILYQAILKGAKNVDEISMYSTLTRIVSISSGLANAAGIAGIIYGAILDQMGQSGSGKPKKKKAKPKREEEDNDEEEERPRKKKPRPVAEDDDE